MPLISVIVPIYKVEQYLDRCIKSILAQTFKDFELILVDDGSPDKCPEMCDEWVNKDNRIKVIHQENQGLSAARNTGIKNVKGNYMTFVDSDDWIAYDMLEILLELISKHDADISICNFVRTSIEEKAFSSDDVIEQIYSKDEFMNIIMKINSNRTIHYAWAKLYKRELIDNEHYPVGMLNEDVEGMFKAVIRSKKIVETSKLGYYYFVNEKSITGQKFGNNFLCLTEVWNRVLQISKQQAPEYDSKVEYNIKRMDFTILIDCILYGDKETDKIYKKELEVIRNRLKTNLTSLLQGPMVFKRKILLVLIRYFFTPIKVIYRLIKGSK